jgi:hypothetical protein
MKKIFFFPVLVLFAFSLCYRIANFSAQTPKYIKRMYKKLEKKRKPFSTTQYPVFPRLVENDSQTIKYQIKHQQPIAQKLHIK